MDQTTGDTADEEVVVDQELYGVLDLLVLLLEHSVELLGLGNSSRETVEDESRRDAR